MFSVNIAADGSVSKVSGHDCESYSVDCVYKDGNYYLRCRGLEISNVAISLTNRNVVAIPQVIIDNGCAIIRFVGMLNDSKPSSFIVTVFIIRVGKTLFDSFSVDWDAIWGKIEPIAKIFEQEVSSFAVNELSTLDNLKLTSGSSPAK